MKRPVFSLSSFLVTFVFVGGLAPIAGADIPDSRTVLRQLDEELAAGAGAPPPAEELRRQQAGLSPEEAAEQWLSQVNGYLRQGASLGTPGGDGGFGQFLKALPDPEAWEALRNRIASNDVDGRDTLQQLHLEFLGAALTGEVERQWELLLEMEEQVLPEEKQADGGSWFSWITGHSGDHRREARMEAVGGLMEAFLLQSDEPDQVRTLLLRRAKHPVSDYGYGELNVPDLVSLLGDDGARELLVQLFRESSRSLRFHRGEATRELAREIALQELDELKAAPWSLVDDVDQVDLFEGLKERFPPSLQSHHDYRRQQAKVYYLFGLVVRGRIAEATALLEKEGAKRESFYLPHGLMKDLERSPHREKLQEFLEAVLAENPELPLWDAYFSLTAARQRSAAAVPFVEKLLDERDWEPEGRMRLRERLADAFIAADQPSEGVELIRANVRTMLNEDQPNQEKLSRILNQGVKLARLGLLLEEPEWQQEGIEVAESAVERDRSEDLRLDQLIRFFEEADLLDKAHEAAVKQLAAKVASFGKRSWSQPEAQSQLIDLARVYHRAGRPADVLVLLEEAPWWGAEDLAAMPQVDGSGDVPIAFMAASALAETGRREEAVALLQELLLSAGGYDPAYELLIELESEGALAWLNRLIELDPFEERPLIWKASIYLDDGRAGEARELVEQAIAIDPSDGEQGRGNRMRAYKVLAQILAELGDAEKAEFYREVVAAIRLSEEADRFYEAGLRQRGVQMYREALNHFADAYCIQSRLATQLQEMGRHEEAEAHYRRAYELMPDSFGRVESHCFGCEGVFAGERAQSVAERVFSRLAEERPEQPQVWYLNGYLEQERGRYDEAIRYFEKAVALDPDYLNAWSKIASVGRAIHLDRSIRDRATLQLLRLDPLQRHVQADLGGMSDLRALWKAVEDAAARQPERREKLLPLPAAAAFMEEQPAENLGFPVTYHISYGMGRFGQAERLQDPASVLANHNLLRQLAEGIDRTLMQ